MIHGDRFVAVGRANVQSVRVAELVRQSRCAGAAVRVRQRVGNLANRSVLFSQAYAAEAGYEIAKTEIASRQNDLVVCASNKTRLLKLFQVTRVAVYYDLEEKRDLDDEKGIFAMTEIILYSLNFRTI